MILKQDHFDRRHDGEQLGHLSGERGDLGGVGDIGCGNGLEGSATDYCARQTDGIYTSTLCTRARSFTRNWHRLCVQTMITGDVATVVRGTHVGLRQTWGALCAWNAVAYIVPSVYILRKSNPLLWISGREVRSII